MFSLLSLPQVVLRTVAETMELLDLIKLCLVSRKFYNTVRKSRRIESLEWTFDDDIDSYIQLVGSKERLNNEACSSYCINFPPPEKLSEFREDVLEGRPFLSVFSPVSILGVPVFVSRTMDSEPSFAVFMVDYTVETQKRYMDVIKLFSKFLHDLFRIDGHIVKFNCTMPSIIDCFVFDYSKKLLEFGVRRDELLTQEELQYIFSQLEFKTLYLHTTLPRDHGQLIPLKSEMVSIQHTDWLDLNAILNSESRSIVVLDDSLSDSDWNRIIKKWLDGGLGKLQKLTMHFEYEQNKVETGIMEGIRNWVQFSEARRPRYYRETPALCNREEMRGWDMQREDGIWATLSIGKFRVRDKWKRNRVELFVWLKEYHL